MHFRTFSGTFGGTCPPPPPIMPFRTFFGMIWKFVGTCKPTSMSFVPTKYVMYRQNIERNGVKMPKFSKLARYTGLYILSMVGFVGILIVV